MAVITIKAKSECWHDRKKRPDIFRFKDFVQKGEQMDR